MRRDTVKVLSICWLVTVLMALSILYATSQNVPPYYKSGSSDVEAIRMALLTLLEQSHDELAGEIAFQESMSWTSPVIKNRRVKKVEWLLEAKERLSILAVHIDEVNN